MNRLLPTMLPIVALLAGCSEQPARNDDVADNQGNVGAVDNASTEAASAFENAITAADANVTAAAEPAPVAQPQTPPATRAEPKTTAKITAPKAPPKAAPPATKAEPAAPPAEATCTPEHHEMGHC